jgi:hypothetical protein
MMDTGGVLAAARGIRPYLVELVGPADAMGVDAEIAGLLAIDDDLTGRAQQLREVLERRVETRMFLQAVLDDAPDFRPPQWQDTVLKGEGYAGLAGDHGPVSAPLYRCPEKDDYDWRRPAVGTPVPVCPTHQVALVRD